MNIPPELLDVLGEVFGGPNSEISREAERSYNRARGLGEGEDYMKAHDLFARKVKTEADYQDISRLKAEVNRLIKGGVENASGEDIARLQSKAIDLSQWTGRDFQLTGTRDENTNRFTSLNTFPLERAAQQAYNEHRTVADEITQNVSPQQAANLSHGYNLLGEQKRQEVMRTAPDKELIGGLVGGGNREDLDRILNEMGKKPPSWYQRMGEKSKGNEGKAYEQIVEKMVQGEQETFREKLEEVSMDKARDVFRKTKEGYASRAEEQRGMVERWRSEGDQTYLDDLRKLREKGFLSEEQATGYVRDRKSIVEDDGKVHQLAADVITSRIPDNAPGAYGYSVSGEAQQGQGGAPTGGSPMGLGAVGGMASRAGTLLGDSSAGQMVGRFMSSGATKKLGSAALTFAALSSAADLTMMSGRTGAGSMTNAATSVLPGVGSLLGSIVPGVGNVAGFGLGYGASKMIGGVMRPLSEQMAYSKAVEGVTGENLQGAGAKNNLSNLIRMAIPGLGAEGAGSLREESNMARLQNPFLDPSQIDALTQSLLELGYSTKQAAENISPLSSVIADFNIDPKLAASLAEIGTTEGGMGGAANARFVAQQIQDASGRGFTQQDMSGYVQQSIQTLGPITGYASAPGTALSYGNLLSRGGQTSDDVFQQSNTVGKFLESDAAIADDPFGIMMAGGNPNLSPQDPSNKAAMASGRIQEAKDLVKNAQKGPDGKLTYNARMMIKGMKSFYPSLSNLSIDEIEQIGIDPNITPQTAAEETNRQEKARKKVGQDQKRRARGEGKVKWDKGRKSDKGVTDLGAGMFLDFPSLAHRDAHRLYEASDKASKGVGALGELTAKNKNIDLKSVRIKGGGTLADAANDPRLLRGLNSGKRKIQVGGKSMSVADFNLADIRDQAYVGDKGRLNMGQPGKAERGGSQRVQVEFTGEAQKYFKTKDVRDPQSAVGANARAVHEHEARTGKKNLHDIPIYGS